MARTLTEIKAQMTSSFINNDTIQSRYELTPGNSFEQEFSKVSLENIFFSIVAFAVWTLESLWDIFKAENEFEMAKQKVHSRQWYRQKALDFQYGFSVVPGTDQFDNTGKTEEEIESSKIVKQAACVKLISQAGYGILRIKAAKESAGELAKLSELEVAALKHYYERYVADAGTQLKVTSNAADDLKLELTVYFDPLVLSTTGQRLDGSLATPVVDAIKSYLKSLEFNGQFVKGDLEEAIRKVEGVDRATFIRAAASKYGSYGYNTTGIQNVGTIESVRVADAGYMRLDESSLQITYIARSANE
jgi:hypothetical protein